MLAGRGASQELSVLAGGGDLIGAFCAYREGSSLSFPEFTAHVHRT